MILLLVLIGSLLLLAVTAFCIFGFLATFESTNNPNQFMVFRIGYAVVGVGCMVGILLLIVNAVRK